MQIAQITDLHIVPEGAAAYRRVVTIPMAERAIARLNQLDPQPDLVLVTGDIVDHGSDEEYAIAARLLAQIKAPVAVGMGNHDRREPFRAALSGFGPLPAEGFIQYVIETRPVRVVMLDSTSDAGHEGEFCAARAAWLQARLAEAPDVPTLVAIHHPPFDTGVVWMDGRGPGWAAELHAVLARHPQVVRVVCGHMHRAISTEVAGRAVTVSPSTAHQVALDLAPTIDLARTLPEFEMEPAGFQLHAWDGARMRTHTVHVEQWDRFPVFTREVMDKLLAARSNGGAAKMHDF